MKKKTEIQQIDFYGILSEESTPLPDPAPVPTSIVQLNTPEHLDLDIRSQINGYLNSVEKNQAREIIGHEHIPLRSIRVPIVPKLSSAWAPNGYGKTYIFTHMQDLSNSFKGFDSSSESLQDYTSILQRSWAGSWIKLHQENPASINLVPYHAMGLVFRHDGESYAMILLFASNFANHGGPMTMHMNIYSTRIFLRPLNSQQESEDFDEISDDFEDKSEDEFDDDDEWNQAEEGWAYLPSKEWMELDLDTEVGNNDAEYQTIAIQALREFVNMSVIYHETPALSERGAFTNLIKSINKENDNDYSEQWASFGQKFSHPISLKKGNETTTWKDAFNDWSIPYGTILSTGSWINPNDDVYVEHFPPSDAQLVVQLEYIAEVLDILTNPMIMHSELFDEKSAEERFESVLSENLFSLDVEQMNGFTPVLEILAQLRRILFTKSSHNQHLRRRLVHQLLMDIEVYCDDKGYVSHPLRTMLDVMLMDYDYQFGTPESEIHSPTRSTAYSDFCIRRKKNPNSTDGGTIIPPVFDAIDDQPSGFYIEGTVPIFQNDDRVGFVDLWPFCFDPDLPNGLKLALPPETSALATNEWMRTWKDFLIRRLLKLLGEVYYDSAEYNSQVMQRFYNILERYLDEGHSGNFDSYSEAIEELESRELLHASHRDVLLSYFHNLNDNVSLFEEQNMPNDDLINRVFSSSKIPLKENPFLMQEEINRCLNPSDEDAPSPWGVETKIEFENGPFRVNFQPHGQHENTILPKHLSFGMRSEVTLQFMLSQFTYECRRLSCENELGFKLLIVDEPEIGRAEHWVNLLIARLRRLHAQLSDDLNGGVLMVSHRSKVLEQASPSGGFTLMQKIPTHIEEEMDDDW